MKNKLKNEKELESKEKAKNSLRSLVQEDKDGGNKSFEDAMEKVWNPDI